MKKIFVLFFVFIHFLYSVEIDEHKVDLYYANGIMMQETKKEAEDTWKIRVRKLLRTTPEAYKRIGATPVSYNISKGMAEDLFESFIQKTNLEPGTASTWYAFKTAIGKIPYIGTASPLLFDAAEYSTKIIHDGTLNTQKASYKESIKAGHGVVVVSHSQGNLFTQEAYRDLVAESKDGWMGNYFHVVSVATPGSEIPNGGHGIIFDNDFITVIPNGMKSNIKTNPNRRDVYIYNAVGDLIGTDKNVKSIQYHGFEYYMGYKVWEKMLDTTRPGEYVRSREVKTDKAKTLIMGWVVNEIFAHDTRPSQWKIKKEKGCICKEKYVEMRHKYDSAIMDTSLAGKKVKDFTRVGGGEGKIYTVTLDGKEQYVKASFGGTMIEEVSEDNSNLCYILTNEDVQTTGEIRNDIEICRTTNSFTPKQEGAIEASVYWSCQSDINMTLLLEGNGVEQKQQDHAYVPKVRDIKPNTSYNGYISGGLTEDSCIDDDYLVENPVTILATLKLPTKRKLLLRYDINSTKGLDIGFYAGVYIKGEEKVIQTTVGSWVEAETIQTYGRVKVYHYVQQSGSGCGIGATRYSCTCMPCEYIPYINKSTITYGPIAGATVEVVAASAYGRVSPEVLYSGETSFVEGKPYESGIIEFTEADYAKFDDDTYYVLSAQGGVDVDRDDNFEEDNESTSNQGTIHAIVKGSAFKSIPFGANVLTEAIYQTSGELLGEGYDAKKLEAKLNDAAKKLLKVKTFTIDNIFEINYGDVLLWSPTTDKEKLYRDYDTFVEPIVVKTYADEARIKESYTLIYERPLNAHPELAHTSLAITPSIDDNTTFGKVLVYNEGLHGIDHIELRGDENERFSINPEGLVHISDASNLLIDTLYTLEMVAIDGEGVESEPVELLIHVVKDNIYDPSASVPQFQDAQLNPIPEDTVGGTVVGQVYFTDENSTIVDYFVSGRDKESFEIDDNGEIKLRENAQVDYERSNIYSIKVTALNIAGNRSLEVTLMFKIIDVEDTPAYAPNYSVHLNENVPYKTIVGHLTQTREGTSSVTSFVLLNANVPFEIDTNGTLYVTGKIDYESKASYGLIAEARTAQGPSNKIEIELYVDDVEPETGSAVLENISLHIAENTPEWTEVGQIVVQDEGASQIQSIKLYGTGHENFRVDSNGMIRVASGVRLDYETDKFYALQAQATNAQGVSDLVSVDIVVDNVADTLPTLGYANYTVLLDASAGSKIGKIPLIDRGEGMILSYSLLVGDVNGTFTIDSNGTLFLDEDVVLTQESLGEYRLGVEVKTTVGSVTQGISIVIREEPLDENVSVPRLESKELKNIAENSPEGTVVGHVTFVDEHSSVVGYTLINSKIFAIDNSGEITLTKKAKIDFEPRVKQEHIVSVQVTATNAQGKESSIELLEFNVSNVQDTPVYERDYSVHVLENAPLGTEVGEVVKTRDGLSAVDVFRLSEYGIPFTIDVNGKIETSGYIDYEKKQQYDFEAVAYTKHGESNTIKIHIEIDDIDPEVGQPRLEGTSIEIEENTNAGTIVGTIGVYEGDSPVERMVLSGQGSARFRVTLSGTVVVAEGASLNYEEQHTYQLFVEAYNAQGNSNAVPLDINISNLIDETGSILNASYEVDENASAGTQIGQLTLGYQSEGTILGYTLVGEGNGNFRVNDNGTIYVSETAILDYETKVWYELDAKLESTLGESALARVTVTVNNISEQLPLLTPLTLSIEENATVGTILGEVENSSTDGKVEAYRLDDNSTFSIDKNGTIVLHSTLDYETQSQYVLSVTASSTVGESVAVDVVIQVEDIPENPPVLKPLTLSIEENATLGTIVGIVEEDTNAEVIGSSPIIAYKLDDNSIFSIDKNGTILLHSALDYETQSQYVLSVTASNAVGESVAVDVVIDIEEIAMIKPVITLLEGNSIWVRIGQDYTEYGATAVDDTDGDITENITIVENVNTTVEGNYSVNYSVINEAGNEVHRLRSVYVYARGECNTSLSITREVLIEKIHNGEDVTQVNTCGVTDMSYLFAHNRTFNQNISGWDVSKVTSMRWMFAGKYEYLNPFNQSIGDWNVSSVTDMSFMFYCSDFNQPIGDWDVSSVTDMHYMFEFAQVFNQPIGDWDVSNVKNIIRMFRGAVSFNQPLGKWNVSNVTTMFRMFNGARAFNQPIGDWDVSSVTNMYEMFRSATAFNQPIGEWDISNVSDHREFSIGSLLEDNNNPFVLTREKLREKIKNGEDVTGVDTSAITDMSYLISTYIRISDESGLEDSNLTEEQKINLTEFNQPIGEWDVSHVTDMRNMFYKSYAFNQPIGEWDVSNVTNMRYMFAEAEKFNQPIGDWDVSNVTSMTAMFFYALAFNQPLVTWDVSNVQWMGMMFETAESFNQPIGDWDVSHVKWMYFMLEGSDFNQPLDHWDVSKVTNMGGLFYGTPFNQDIGDWNVSNVTSMRNMFSFSEFNQVINLWDVSKVTTMHSMFYDAKEFNQPIEDWDVSTVTNMSYMFYGSQFNQFIGSWDVSNVTAHDGFAEDSPLEAVNLPSFP